jgi:deoxyribonuclease V
VLACVDVSYDGNVARAGCILFNAWADATAADALTVTTRVRADYTPGELYRRELPPIREVLARVSVPLETIIVDGYVWLAGHGPGLGAHLYEALDARVAIVGVAKTPWTRPPADDESAVRRVVPVFRGTGSRPLYVTAAGIDPDIAAAHVERMHGAHRLPTLLKAVDSLVRGQT